VVDITPRSREITVEKKPLSMMLPKDRIGQSEAPPKVRGEGAGDRFGSFTVTRTFEKPKSAGILPDKDPVDEVLLTKLKDLRRELAQAGKVPAYIVFSDASLRDMCRRQPTTKAAFLGVSGVGEVKMEKYGDAFTRLIGEYRGKGGDDFYGTEER
jgi:ATP-dependent DNA helicase RecQ